MHEERSQEQLYLFIGFQQNKPVQLL